MGISPSGDLESDRGTVWSSAVSQTRQSGEAWLLHRAWNKRPGKQQYTVSSLWFCVVFNLVKYGMLPEGTQS